MDTMSALISVSAATVDTLLWHAAGILLMTFLLAHMLAHLLKRLMAHLDKPASSVADEADSDYDTGWFDGYAAAEADAADKRPTDLVALAPDFPDLDEDRVTEDTGRHAVGAVAPQETTGYIPVVSTVDDEAALAAVRAVSGGDGAA